MGQSLWTIRKRLMNSWHSMECSHATLSVSLSPSRSLLKWQMWVNRVEWVFFFAIKNFKTATCSELWILKFHLQQEQSKSDISTESYSSFPQPCSLFFNCFLPYMAIFSQPQSAQNSILKADFPHTKPFPGHWWNKKFQTHFSQKKKSHLKHLFNPVHPHLLKWKFACCLVEVRKIQGCIGGDGVIYSCNCQITAKQNC